MYRKEKRERERRVMFFVMLKIDVNDIFRKEDYQFKIQQKKLHRIITPTSVILLLIDTIAIIFFSNCDPDSHLNFKCLCKLIKTHID
jgi:hypothetical protein